jgi:hypothetical protein
MFGMNGGVPMATVMCVAQKAPVNWVRFSHPLLRRVIGAVIGLPVALLLLWVGSYLFSSLAEYAAERAKAGTVPLTAAAATAGAQTDRYLPGKGAGCKW